MTDDGVHIELSAQDAGLMPMLQDMEQRLGQIEVAFNRVRNSSVESAAGLEALSRAASGVGTTMELVGVESAGAAQHVRLMNDAVKELTSAAGPLLVSIVGLEAAFKAGQFLQDGVKGAADLQSQMDTLRATVESQGGSWKEASAAIEAFANQESIASGFTREQLVPALNQLVTAGMDVHDAMQTMIVAEELARAKHIQVEEAVNALIEAEAGRGRGLVRLDTNLKDIVQTHGHLSDVLKQLHKDYGHVIDDSNNLEMSQARLKAVEEASGEELGKTLLPLMTAWNETMIGAVKNAEEFGREFVAGFNASIDAIKGAAGALDHFAEGMADFVGGNFKGASEQLSEAGNSARVAFHGLGEELRSVDEMFQHLFINSLDSSKSAHAIGAALVAHNVAGHDRAFTGQLDDNSVIGMGGQHTGSRSSGGRSGSSRSGSSAAGDTPFHMALPVDQIHDVVQALKSYDDEIKALPHNIDGYNEAIAKLNKVINDETFTQKELSSKQQQAKADYEGLLAVQKDMTAELDRKGHATKQERQDLADVTAATDAALKKYNALTGELQKNTAELDKHRQMLADEKKGLADLQDGFDKYVQSANANMQKDLATFQMTNAQKVQYYAQMVASIQATDADSLHLKEQYYNDELNAYKAMVNEEYNTVHKFVDDVITQHKSLKDILKSIYDDILKAFVDMVTKMIVESNLFKGIFGNLAGGVGQVGPGGVPILSLFGGGSSAGALSNGAVAAPTLIPGANGQWTTVDTPQGSALNVHIGGIASGIAAGALIAGLDHGNAQTAEMLGALGGAFFGPLGGIAGGLLGSILGPHDPFKPINEPDKYEPVVGGVQYGQFVADINADPNANMNGQHFSASSQYAQQGEAQQVAAELKNLPATISGGLKADADQLKALIGSSTDPLALKIASEKDDMFTLVSGAHIKVEDYMKLITDFQSQMASNPAAAQSPVFTINRTYPDYNLAHGGSSGTIPGPNDKKQLPGSGGPGDHNPPGGGGHGGLVTIHVQGSIIGTSPEALALEISQIMRRMNDGTSFGGFSTNRRSNF